MENSHWILKDNSTQEIKNCYVEGHLHISTFKNISKNPLIEKIIRTNLNFTILRTISIIFSKKKSLTCHINEIHKDLENLCINMKNKIEIYLNEVNNEIIIKGHYKYLMQKIIYYLENIEKIYPKDIFRELLTIGLLKPYINFYSYPSILKNNTNKEIKLIDFKYLNKLDKKYHDTLINSLCFNQKIELLEINCFNKFPSINNYDLIKNLINTNLDINDINELIKIIELLTEQDSNLDKIYDNTNIYIEYLNHLSNEAILNKLNYNNISINRAFEILNYLYTQCDLSFDDNIKLVKIINNNYKQKEFVQLKNKILCKLITNNCLDNNVFDHLTQYEDSIEALVKFIRNIQNL